MVGEFLPLGDGFGGTVVVVRDRSLCSFPLLMKLDPGFAELNLFLRQTSPVGFQPFLGFAGIVGGETGPLNMILFIQVHDTHRTVGGSLGLVPGIALLGIGRLRPEASTLGIDFLNEVGSFRGVVVGENFDGAHDV